MAGDITAIRGFTLDLPRSTFGEKITPLGRAVQVGIVGGMFQLEISARSEDVSLRDDHEVLVFALRDVADVLSTGVGRAFRYRTDVLSITLQPAGLLVERLDIHNVAVFYLLVVSRSLVMDREVKALLTEGESSDIVVAALLLLAALLCAVERLVSGSVGVQTKYVICQKKICKI